jgi:hypothetical protein
VRGAWGPSRVVSSPVCRVRAGRRPADAHGHAALDGGHWRIWLRAGPRTPEPEFSSLGSARRTTDRPRVAGAPDSLMREGILRRCLGALAGARSVTWTANFVQAACLPQTLSRLPHDTLRRQRRRHPVWLVLCSSRADLRCLRSPPAACRVHGSEGEEEPGEPHD